MSEEIINDFPECPHCGYVDEPGMADLRYDGDGEILDIDCPSCDQEYKTKVSISVTFTSWRDGQ